MCSTNNLRIFIKTLNCICVFNLIFVGFFLTSCSQNQILAPQDINKITLKLSKKLDIELKKIGSSNTTFNMMAKVSSETKILQANVIWIITDSEDHELFRKSNTISLNQSNFEIESETFQLQNEEENYKVVFIFNGKTESEDINKTSIYYTKTQDELDKALSDLKDRANK